MENKTLQNRIDKKNSMGEALRKNPDMFNDVLYRLFPKDEDKSFYDIFKERQKEIENNTISPSQFIDELARKIIETKQQNNKQPQRYAKTLNPCITTSQITRLYTGLQGIFEATPKQWTALFSETEIQIKEPIKAKAVADIALLLLQLHRCKFIKAKEYAAIIGRTKAFSFNGKPITAKQINATKERSNWWKDQTPIIGDNYTTINKAVTAL
jgi:hypothetical protein